MKKLYLTAVLSLMAAFLFAPTASAQTYTFGDDFGFVWTLEVIDTGVCYYLLGTVETPFDETRTAVGTYLFGTRSLVLAADAGAGVPFYYHLVWVGASGSGGWMNVSSPAGYGTVNVYLTDGDSPPVKVKPHTVVPGM